MTIFDKRFTAVEAQSKNPLRLLSLAVLLSMVEMASAAPPDKPTNGQLYRENSDITVWNTRSAAWVSPEVFWLDYAENKETRFWGRATQYPPYNEVGEHDTLLIEVKGGPCLMYFFHNRWRRAQDVKRWDPVFNDILGCPHVFD